jgi:uncharacterized protein YndB with AHSA1/START domain
VKENTMTETAEKTEAGERSLVLTRVFDAPRSRVFQAWTDPEDLFVWGAPHGFTVTQSDGDARPGGPWRAAMRSPDGTEHRNGGVYLEVEEPARLVYTFAWDDADGSAGHETIVTILFDEQEGGEQEGGTRMTFRQETFESTAERDGHAGGWSEAFERLDQRLSER